MEARDSRPRFQRELRLWLATSERLAAGLAPLCEAEALRADDWQPPPVERPPHILLVETCADWAEAPEELDRLLESCAGAGVPCLLWVTASPVGSPWLERCDRFRRVLTVDAGQLAELEAAGASEPCVLWPATTSPVAEWKAGGATARSDAVVWLGGWSRDWPAAWQEMLATVLRGAARRGLRIIEVAELDGLPSELRHCVAGPGPGEDPETALRRARIVIGADPRHGAARLAPQVVFDAAAARAAAITTHDFVSYHDFAVGGTPGAEWRNLVPIVHDSEITVEEIDRLLDDDLLREETVEHFVRIVANNHTYAHRLATLASTAGLRFVPDASIPAPA